jgi:flagellin
VDSILQTIDRLAGGTVFGGRKLLDGSFDYNTSGVNTTLIRDLHISTAPGNFATNVLVNVTQSAQTGHLTYTGGVVGSGGVTIEVAGTKGTTQLSFASGTTVTAIAAAITSVKAATGVSAAVNAGNVDINSTGYGASSFVSIRTVSGTFTGAGKASGRNAAVTINGSAASVDGLAVKSTGGGVNLAFSLSSLANTVGSTSFAITGGGATFQAGPSVTFDSYASIGLQAVSTAGLGSLDLGFLSSLRSGGANAITGKSLTGAQDIVTASISQVSTLRGRIGAFIKYDLGSTINNLEVQLENLTAAESAIRDTDYAAEVSNLTRAQILVQAGTSVLAQANQSPQIALQLLRGATGG